jgi:hypothetical protein
MYFLHPRLRLHSLKPQDLEVIETAITQIENIKRAEQGGDYLQYTLGTLSRAWCWIVGSPRPERPPIANKRIVFKNQRLPKTFGGTWCIPACVYVFMYVLKMNFVSLYAMCV